MVKVFIGNCSDQATNDDLRALFSKFGTVVEADVITGKGFGFVHMETQDQADAAIAALDGTDLKGKKIHVELSTGGGRRSAGASGNGGPTRSRGGSVGRGGAGFAGRDTAGYGAPQRQTGARDYYNPPAMRPQAPSPYSADPYGYGRPPQSYDRTGYAAAPAYGAQERFDPRPQMERFRYDPYRQQTPAVGYYQRAMTSTAGMGHPRSPVIPPPLPPAGRY